MRRKVTANDYGEVRMQNGVADIYKVKVGSLSNNAASMRNGNKRNLLALIRKWWVPVAFIILPLITIFLAGLHEWIVRIVVLAIVFPLGIATLLWYALSPKTQIIKTGAKLNDPNFSNKTRRRVNLFLRVLLCLVGLMLMVSAGRFFLDIGSILGGGVSRAVEGYVCDNSSFFGLWFLYQKITLKHDEDIRGQYYLFYSCKPRIHRNTYYEFLILPRSKVVLEAKKSAKATSKSGR